MNGALDNPAAWSAEQDKLYHQLIHLPEQVWKAAFEPDVAGERSNLADSNSKVQGLLLTGDGVGMFAARLAQALLPINVAVQTAPEPHDVAADWLTVQLLSPGQAAPSPQADAVVVPADVELPAGLLCARYDSSLPAAACLGAMLFSLCALLERCGLLADTRSLARPVIAILMQKAGAIAVGLDSEMNMAKKLAGRLDGGVPVFVPLLPELELVADLASAQMNHLAGLPAKALANVGDKDMPAAWREPPWMPVLLNRLDANGLPVRSGTRPVELADAPELCAEGESLLERFFSLAYPLTLVAFYLSLLREDSSLQGECQ
ncbi:MAG: hypothetical protein K8R90_03860 [Candidatus Cloacimonetes bacterium]|nr:hypothetical protein [Candidatus Cloacimonadota bacterium]